LGGKKKNGKGWKCLCPCHADKKPSLCLDDGDDGTILVNCKAGCPQDKVIGELKHRNLWPERKPTDIFEYTDDDGVVSFEVCCYADDPKRLTRHWDGHSYVWHAQGRKRYLLYLPEIAKAKEVWLAEGEKDAKALAGLGLCGTTAPFGA